MIAVTICGTPTILFSALFLVYTAYNGELTDKPLRSLFFLLILCCGLWFFSRILFYSVSATKNCLESRNIVGSTKSFSWDEIVEVRRARFGVPVDFSYVVSKNNGKLRLIRSMRNYQQLIELIKDRAPNLTTCRY